MRKPLIGCSLATNRQGDSDDMKLSDPSSARMHAMWLNDSFDRCSKCIDTYEFPLQSEIVVVRSEARLFTRLMEVDLEQSGAVVPAGNPYEKWGGLAAAVSALDGFQTALQEDPGLAALFRKLDILDGWANISIDPDAKGLVDAIRSAQFSPEDIAKLNSPLLDGLIYAVTGSEVQAHESKAAFIETWFDEHASIQTLLRRAMCPIFRTPTLRFLVERYRTVIGSNADLQWDMSSVCAASGRIEELLALGVPIVIDEAVDTAAKHGHLDSLKMLANYAEARGLRYPQLVCLPALRKALRNAHLAVADWLLRTCAFSWTTAAKYAVVNAACASGVVDVMNWVRANVPDISMTEWRQQMPYLAVCNQAEAIRWMLDTGAVPEVIDFEFSDALSDAIQFGSRDAAEVMVAFAAANTTGPILTMHHLSRAIQGGDETLLQQLLTADIRMYKLSTFIPSPDLRQIGPSGASIARQQWDLPVNEMPETPLSLLYGSIRANSAGMVRLLFQHMPRMLLAATPNSEVVWELETALRLAAAGANAEIVDLIMQEFQRYEPELAQRYAQSIAASGVASLLVSIPPSNHNYLQSAVASIAGEYGHTAALRVMVSNPAVFPLAQTYVQFWTHLLRDAVHGGHLEAVMFIQSVTGPLAPRSSGARGLNLWNGLLNAPGENARLAAFVADLVYRAVEIDVYLQFAAAGFVETCQVLMPYYFAASSPSDRMKARLNHALDVARQDGCLLLCSMLLVECAPSGGMHARQHAGGAVSAVLRSRRAAAQQ